MTKANILPQHSSNTVEWNTPPEIIKLVHQLFGIIVLDPASNNFANQTIKAKKYYTKDNSGLDYSWKAKTVFLNPPYARMAGVFTDKLIIEFNEGNIGRAILLVNSNTSTKYYQNALRNCQAICFPEKRIKFIDAEGSRQPRPPHSNTIFYFDNSKGNVLKFKQVFKSLGAVVMGAAI